MKNVGGGTTLLGPCGWRAGMGDMWLSAVRAAQNNNESRGGVQLVVALELSPLAEEVGPGPAEGPRAKDRLM